jgi:Zn-finger nucleic acid-binding protein
MDDKKKVVVPSVLKDRVGYRVVDGRRIIESNVKDDKKGGRRNKRKIMFKRPDVENIEESRKERYGVWLDRGNGNELVYVGRDMDGKKRFMESKKYKEAMDRGDWIFKDENK